MSITTTTSAKPTIVLVHGAFAESSSWNGVITALLDEGGAALASDSSHCSTRSRTPSTGTASSAARSSARRSKRIWTRRPGPSPCGTRSAVRHG